MSQNVSGQGVLSFIFVCLMGVGVISQTTPNEELRLRFFGIYLAMCVVVFVTLGLVEMRTG